MPALNWKSATALYRLVWSSFVVTLTIIQSKGNDVSETWLPSLKTATPQEGFDLATKLARVGVKVTQPSAEIRDKLRAAYDQDTTQLIASSQVIAVHFQTVAAANNYWRD